MIEISDKPGVEEPEPAFKVNEICHLHERLVINLVWVEEQFGFEFSWLLVLLFLLFYFLLGVLVNSFCFLTLSML